MKNDRLEMNLSLCFTCFLQAVSKWTCPTHSNLRISFLIIFFLQEKKKDSEINVIGVGRECGDTCFTSHEEPDSCRNSSQITDQNISMKFNTALSVAGAILLNIAGKKKFFLKSLTWQN